MQLLCLKCEKRYPDDRTDPCSCGAKEWALIDAPLKDLEITINDRRFLQQLRIDPKV